MSMFSRITSDQIDWDKYDTEQKLEALARLAPNDPLLEQLALRDADERVRHKAILRMEAEAQWRLAGAIRPEDEACLAACLGERCDDSVTASGDVLAQLLSAPPSFRVALVAHSKSAPLAIALTQSLDQDSDRARVVRGKGAIDARAAAARAMRDVELLEVLALEFRDKQRRIFRAARDRADELLAAREARRHALELCERLERLLARHELTLTAFSNAEREWLALAPPPAQDAGEFAALQTRYAALKERARALLQEQGKTWRDAERLKVVLAEITARSDADDAVDPAVLAALVAERETAAATLSQAALAAIPKVRQHLADVIGKLTERHAILAFESKELVNARRLVEELRADPAALTPAWRADFARAVAIVRPALRAPIEEAAAAARSTIDAATRQQIEAQRAAWQQFCAEIDALVKQMEQLLDKGQHREANETANVLRDTHTQVPGARALPATLEFGLKRCQDRLRKMNEWKHFADVQAREALCREAEALVKRVARQEKSPAASGKRADFPWPVSAQLPAHVAEAAAPAGIPESHPAESTAMPPTSPEGMPAPAPPRSNPDLAPLAPEGLALAVRDLQTRWQKLDKGQGASSKGLWERFRRACDRAYAPAKKHFEELEQRRSENADKKNAVLEKIAALDARIVDGAEWGRILSERGDLVRTWFEAGALPRKNARAMQKKFDALTAGIDARLDARRAEERARRRALIEQAKVISDKPADGASMAAMIALQKQWQDGMRGVIRLKAKEDQAMWEEFRAAGSALFGKRDAEKASRNAERDALLAGRRGLIDEFDALAAGNDATALKHSIDELSARWHAMEWPERKPLRDLELKFSNARAAAMARIATIRAEAEIQRRAAAAARLAVVERAEQTLGNGSTPDMDAVRAELQGMLAEGEQPDSRVLARMAVLEAAVKIGPDAWRAQAEKTQTERDALLLELEIVLGLPSPPELAAERRMRMLKRLAESKNSRSTPPLMAPDATKALEKLLALPLAMHGARARVEAVMEAAGRQTR